MRFGVFEEPGREELLLFRLKANDAGSVVQLVIVDKDGRMKPLGVVLTLSDQGIHRCYGLGDFGIARETSKSNQVKDI